MDEIILYFGEFEKIVINNTVKNIKRAVFLKDKNLKEIEFQEPSVLETIESHAFDGSVLKSLVFPDSLKIVENEAFLYCKELQRIEFGNHLEFIGREAFKECTELTDVIFKNSLYDIDKMAFQNCYNLNNVQFGNGVVSIGNYSFYNCNSLTKVNFPKTLKSLSELVFQYSGLVEVVFDKDAPITRIPVTAFMDCIHLEKYTFPNSVKAFGSKCFFHNNFTIFEIPPSLETIELYCFSECKKLEKFIIPEGSNLKTIEFHAFYGCFAFTKIICHSINFEVVNEALYTKDRTRLIVVPPNSPVKYFPFSEKLKVVGQSALLHCIHIHQVFVPSDSVEEIENNAFEDCFNLKVINLPICVTKVGPLAFQNCKSLKCGLLIENRTKEYTDNLVIEALLPKKCLLKCDRLCSIKRANINVNINALTVVMLFIQD